MGWPGCYLGRMASFPEGNLFLFLFDSVHWPGSCSFSTTSRFICFSPGRSIRIYSSVIGREPEHSEVQKQSVGTPLTGVVGSRKDYHQLTFFLGECPDENSLFPKYFKTKIVLCRRNWTHFDEEVNGSKRNFLKGPSMVVFEDGSDTFQRFLPSHK